MNATAPLFHLAHASGLNAVERQLAVMHQEMLRRSGEEAREVRLSVLNLVAACVDNESADIASQTVALIAENHPARALIVVADRNATEGIEADVSLQCALTRHGQICAEEVRLTVGGRAALHLDSIVSPLLVPDVPVFLWLVGAPPMEQAFGVDAIAISDRIIIDTGAYEDPAETIAMVSAAVDANSGRLQLADLAWARLRRWRELVAQAFDGAEMHALLNHITAVEIESSGQSVSAAAWLLAGWMAAQLGWSGDAPALTMSAQGPADIPGRELLSVRLGCADGEHTATVTVRRREATLNVTIDVDSGITADQTVPVRRLDTAHLVGSLLEEDTEDPVYGAALRSATHLSRR